MRRALETVAPARLGIGFRWLLGSSWASNLSDGILLAVGPLLVASLTRDAFLVSLAATVQWLPPLVFGLLAGAVTDRVDRRLLVVAANLVRVVVFVLLTTAVATTAVSITAVLASLFVLATAEVFADNTTSTLLPTLLDRDDLAIGNARVQTGVVTLNQLAGPPVGAALFTAGAAWAFGAQAVLVALAAVLVSRIALPPTGRDTATRSHLWADITEGVRWVRHHPAIRTLVITIFTFNITFGAAWSVLVLYATRRLELGEVGFGLVTTVMAAGGLVGTVSYGRITRRISLGDLMRIGLVIETLTHLALALTSSPWVAMPVFFVFGMHAFVWGTTSITIRQRAVPRQLQGRVGSVNLVGTMGGLVVGSLLGGVLAQRAGITAPFWFAFLGSAIFLLLIWRPLRHVAHADERTATPP